MKEHTLMACFSFTS